MLLCFEFSRSVAPRNLDGQLATRLGVRRATHAARPSRTIDAEQQTRVGSPMTKTRAQEEPVPLMAKRQMDP